MKSSFTATMINRGRITIPKRVRDAYQLEEGMTIRFFIDKIVDGTHLLYSQTCSDYDDN